MDHCYTCQFFIRSKVYGTYKWEKFVQIYSFLLYSPLSTTTGFLVTLPPVAQERQMPVGRKIEIVSAMAICT